jgi:hypothetical protein
MAGTAATSSGFPRVVVGLLLFGTAFGYVEAAVVVYLRAVYDPVRRQLNPAGDPGELFPLIRVEQLQQLDRAAAGENGPAALPAVHMRRLRTELGRELATLVMLAGAALLASRGFHQWIAAFVVAFGLWDIFYYVFLKVLIGWPASLMTWDILFLLPVPWVGPVAAPVLVSAVMIACGLAVLRREGRGRAVAFGPACWAALCAGAIVIIVSFCLDWRNISAGGHPRPFAWPVFLAGLALGIAGFLVGLFRSAPR